MMDKIQKREVIAHHAMAAVGGFCGIYAIENRSENFGSSETANLIYLFAAGLSGNYREMLIRILAFCCYIGGIVFVTLAARKCKNKDARYVALIVEVIGVFVLAQIPADIHPIIALYPMFFMMAVQWPPFSNAGGFSSATVFSTNNCRQCFSGLVEYLCDRDPKYLARFQVFGGTLICFHLGVVYSWLCMQRWGLKSIYACLPLLFLGWLTTWRDRSLRNADYRARRNHGTVQT